MPGSTSVVSPELQAEIIRMGARIVALREACIDVMSKTEPATPAYDAARLAIQADNKAAGN